MPVRLGSNQYGKARVRFARVVRSREAHEFCELTVDIALKGDFEAAHTEGRNAHVLPTDTMKNTVYALGSDHAIDSIESFTLDLARHFVRSTASVHSARVAIAEVRWNRLSFDGMPHPYGFSRCAGDRPFCITEVSNSDEAMTSGVRDLVLLKTTDSAFSGYLRDGFTTLKETRDRIMASSITATWPQPAAQSDFVGSRTAITDALIRCFAQHKSESVQHTLYAMGREALAACTSIPRITLTMPNLHYLPVNIKPFPVAGRCDVYLPIDEPHGLIEATIERK